MIYPNILQALILTVWFLGFVKEISELYRPVPAPQPGAFIRVRRGWDGRIKA